MHKEARTTFESSSAGSIYDFGIPVQGPNIRLKIIIMNCRIEIIITFWYMSMLNDSKFSDESNLDF